MLLRAPSPPLRPTRLISCYMLGQKVISFSLLTFMIFLSYTLFWYLVTSPNYFMAESELSPLTLLSIPQN